MNLEEARKVYWLRNNRKTLGQLLDEGYLNQSRLEWAAEKAYDPTLRQAAQKILESMKTPSSGGVQEKSMKVEDAGADVGISLDNARVTLWPFNPYKDQEMGSLLESKQITLRDLGYAIENAWDEKVRKAAIALSLVRLGKIVDEPIPSAGFVKIVSGGRSYSERRESLVTLRYGFLLGFLITSIFYLVFSSLGRVESRSTTKQFTEVASTANGIFAIVLVLGLTLFVLWFTNFALDKITERFEKKIHDYRLGQEGEDQAVQTIAQVLDGNWHLFRNVVIPGKNKGDLDIVLVGPPGVWVLEVKNFHGEYRNLGDAWEYKSGNKWKTTSVNPSEQARNNTFRLKNFLKADKIDVFVNSAVVWMNGILAIENPTVAIWQYDRLADELGNIWYSEKLSKVEQDQIVVKLKKLCVVRG